MSRVVCPVCGDVIGVYEPLVVVGADSIRTSSLASEPGLRSGGELLVHVACASDLESGETDRRPFSAGDSESLEQG